MRRVLRYNVPVDNEWHRITTAGVAMFVGCKEQTSVDLWAVEGATEPVTMEYRVFGTGHPVPDGAFYVGTAITPPSTFAPTGVFVRHVFMRYVREENARGKISSHSS